MLHQRQISIAQSDSGLLQILKLRVALSRMENDNYITATGCVGTWEIRSGSSMRTLSSRFFSAYGTCNIPCSQLRYVRSHRKILEVRSDVAHTDAPLNEDPLEHLRLTPLRSWIHNQTFVGGRSSNAEEKAALSKQFSSRHLHKLVVRTVLLQ